MIHWESKGSALLPDCLEDKDGVYSGSAVEANGQMHLFYTGNTKINHKRKSYQKHVISNDGQTFVKQESNIKTPPEFSEHHRDPKVWKDSGYWWMIVGAQSIDNKGAITLFKSLDLNNWTYEGVVFNDSILDQMCECPDYFKLQDGIEVLTLCPQKRTPYQESDKDISSYAGYIIGKMDTSTNKFEPHESLKLLDEGFDFYAPQSFTDNKGRRIITGWMSRMNDAQEKYLPTQPFGYVHCLTLPRVVTYEGGKLRQNPITEIESLRSDKYIVNNCFKLPSEQFEIIINTTKSFKLNLRDENVKLSYDELTGLFTVYRKDWVTEKHEKRSKVIDQMKKVRIIGDTSALEIFVNDGISVFSLRYFVTDETLYANYCGNEEIILYNLGGPTDDE